MNTMTQAVLEPRAPGAERAPVTRAPVSVVIPCYRCEKTIEEAVASIAAQTLPPAEILLVEDASGAETLAALHRVAAAYGPDWIKVIALPANGGPSMARNVGWEQAQQPYIALLDADDTWAPRKLELQMAALQADPSIALIAHQVPVRTRGTPAPEPRLPAEAQIVGRRTLLVRNPFPTSSVVLRRDLPYRFDVDYRRSEDYLLWSQIVFSGYRCAKIEQPLAIANRREDGEVGLSDDFAAVHRGRSLLRRKLVREGLLTRREYVYASAAGMANKMRLQFLRRMRHLRRLATSHAQA
ncbi:MAG TPA: glycosyltransferase family 2 protein [Frateuria sp.]|uniref:glycosyltransferase family 2 protein n=1 Tax=Frateuria sp. TaxID=2211372 RepID=UPI002DE49468|nr:glycosyltransferase family 2 protein [Frateuria sp.]